MPAKSTTEITTIKRSVIPSVSTQAAWGRSVRMPHSAWGRYQVSCRLVSPALASVKVREVRVPGLLQEAHVGNGRNTIDANRAVLHAINDPTLRSCTTRRPRSPE